MRDRLDDEIQKASSYRRRLDDKMQKASLYRHWNDKVVRLLFDNHLANVYCNLVKFLCWLVPDRWERAILGYCKPYMFRRFAFKMYPEARARSSDSKSKQTDTLAIIILWS